MVVLKVEHSFLNNKICLQLKEFAVNHYWRDLSDPFWSGRLINFASMQEQISPITNSIKQKIQNYIKTNLHNEVYCDTIDLVRWQHGKEMPPHKDAMDNYMYRDWGSILYLNDDYSGGNTYYPEFDVEIKPQTGTLIVHEGNILHGVKTVYGNTRYTIASFWTKDKTKATYDRLYQ